MFLCGCYNRPLCTFYFLWDHLKSLTLFRLTRYVLLLVTQRIIEEQIFYGTEVHLGVIIHWFYAESAIFQTCNGERSNQIWILNVYFSTDLLILYKEWMFVLHILKKIMILRWIYYPKLRCFYIALILRPWR